MLFAVRAETVRRFLRYVRGEFCSMLFLPRGRVFSPLVSPRGARRSFLPSCHGFSLPGPCSAGGEDHIYIYSRRSGLLVSRTVEEIAAPVSRSRSSRPYTSIPRRRREIDFAICTKRNFLRRVFCAEKPYTIALRYGMIIHDETSKRPPDRRRDDRRTAGEMEDIP